MINSRRLITLAEFITLTVTYTIYDIEYYTIRNLKIYFFKSLQEFKNTTQKKTPVNREQYQTTKPLTFSVSSTKVMVVVKLTKSIRASRRVI